MVDFRYSGELAGDPQPVGAINVRLREATQNRKWGPKNAVNHRKPIWIPSSPVSFRHNSAAVAAAAAAVHAFICHSWALPYVVEVSPQRRRQPPHDRIEEETFGGGILIIMGVGSGDFLEWWSLSCRFMVAFLKTFEFWLCVIF